MLEDSLFESQGRKKTRRPVVVVVSVAAHVVTILALVLIPLLQIQALPVPKVDLSMWLPHVQTPKPIEVFSVHPRVQRSTAAPPSAFVAPPLIPEKIAVVVDEPPRLPAGFVPVSGDGVRGSSLIDLISNHGTIEPPPAPPVAPTPPPPPVVMKPELLRRGGDVQAANLIYQVKPVYPPLARQARVQGAVVVEAIINKDGAIESLRVISGNPLLNQAAVDAVKQWRYRPTLLNGDPVPVLTTVTVTFTLQ